VSGIHRCPTPSVSMCLRSCVEGSDEPYRPPPLRQHDPAS
jgi:hypothetical protein